MILKDRKPKEDYRKYKFEKTKRNCLRCSKSFISVTKTTFLCDSCKRIIDRYDLKLCMNTK